MEAKINIKREGVLLEEIIKKSEVPKLPDSIKIQKLSKGAFPNQEIYDLSKANIRNIVNKVRMGKCSSLMMAPDWKNEEGFLMLESSDDLIFLQIWNEKTKTAWSCFNPEFLDSDGETLIEPSDGQPVSPLKFTMKDQELAAKCVEWYAYTCKPYPGMDWLKKTRKQSHEIQQ